MNADLIKDLPDPAAAERFFAELSSRERSAAAKLQKKPGLFGDVLTLASYSPLLATTMIQTPQHLTWLDRRRLDAGVRGKEELLESLARFSLTNSTVEPQVLFSRFRRRELLRIYLHDIRRLVTVAEITDELSHLADAILENALRLARQEVDNRYGQPLLTLPDGRTGTAELTIVSLGKLGSRELNYASDIDLLFIYSADGMTSGIGSGGSVTNREYFSKLAELTVKLVGHAGGEGAAYRVDLRLRPHGRIGALALSLADTVKYYKTEAADWEKQVLIRSRSSAGSRELFDAFFAAVQDSVFSPETSVAASIRNVRLSKEKIDREHGGGAYNVKLGRGGIREIEFIAQALQLAFGGRDKWLRSPHSLISISRLADRGHLRKAEMTQLFGAYEFLRRLEHVLQMEHGLQTHTLPVGEEKLLLVARKMRFSSAAAFQSELERHRASVRKIFDRVFKHADEPTPTAKHDSEKKVHTEPAVSAVFVENEGERAIRKLSPRFSGILDAFPGLADSLPDLSLGVPDRDYHRELLPDTSAELAIQFAELRRKWMKMQLEIAVFDLAGKITLRRSKDLQTELAEAAIAAALSIAETEMARRTSGNEAAPEGLAILALGKMGSGGMDYGSDLDLVLVYDDSGNATPRTAEYYAKLCDIFVAALSNLTRDGSLYRVDRRLRPHGTGGPSVIGVRAFTDYMQREAAIWELLAYVKIRSVGGDRTLGISAEAALRTIIHERAAAIDPNELAAETIRLRTRLEEQKAANLRSKEIDIKFGPGGMLDVYFAVRFLQLRDSVADAGVDRSTSTALRSLAAAGSLSDANAAAFLNGYAFLTEFDHWLRLMLARSTRVPLANTKVLEAIAGRMDIGTGYGLLHALNMHRLEVRSAFQNVLNIDGK